MQESKKGLHVGGNANNGANAGSLYANANNTPSNTNANIGSHLCLKKNALADLGSCQKTTILKKALVGKPKTTFVKQRNEAS